MNITLIAELLLYLFKTKALCKRKITFLTKKRSLNLKRKRNNPTKTCQKKDGWMYCSRYELELFWFTISLFIGLYSDMYRTFTSFLNYT